MDLSPGLTSVKLCLDIEAALISFFLLGNTTMITHRQAAVWRCLQFSETGEAKDAPERPMAALCSVFHR